MGKYKAEHGFQIKHRSSDPPSPAEGEIWYNTTTQVLKVAPYLESWSSGGNLGAATGGCRSCGTLPASPSLGDSVTVIDYAGTSDSNNITIGRNSQPIMGSAADLTVATERAAFTLVYVDSTNGWLLTEK